MWPFVNHGDKTGKSVSLSPYVLKLKEGHLVGMAPEPSASSPCVQCIQKWLLERQIPSTHISLLSAPIRPELIERLKEEANPHTCYEVTADGTEIRLDNCIFPHPDCDCNRETFIVPKDFHWNLSFAFSPMSQIKCVRYTTPINSLWVASVTGKSAQSREVIRSVGSGASKEIARKKAIQEWMKKASLSDFRFEFNTKNPLIAESLQTMTQTQVRIEDPLLLGLGAGQSYEQAILDSLYELTKKRTLQRYSDNLKNPILVVGTNAWLRNKLPFFMLQEYDWYILFYPNSSPCWVLGIAGFSRLHSEAKPLFAFHAHANMEQALDGVLAKALELCRPEADMVATPPISQSDESDRARQKNLWWTHWIYRCSKISLKELQSMESYSEDLELWRSFYRDGQPAVSLVPPPQPHYPKELILLVQARLHEFKAPVAKVIGIGTARDFLQ